MKIAIIVYFFPPKWIAGTEIATYYLAEHLAMRGHEVHVITRLDKGLPRDCFEKGFYIHRLPYIRVRFAGVLIFWMGITRTIRRIAPDVVQVQGLDIAVPALISRKVKKIPYVVWGQGDDIYQPSWFMRLTAKPIMKNAYSVIALTDVMKKNMLAINDRNITVIPNGINLKEYAYESPVEKMENPVKKILFVGRFNPVKGLRYLLLAMQIIHKEIPNARLILVGDGEERNYLEELVDNLGIRECTDFVGKIPHERIPDFMRQADVFVLSSLSEGLPVTVLEAMASSLPIVATRVGGLPDIIENGVNGYLVESKDYLSLAKNILEILKTPELNNSMSKNNYEKVKKFEWENIVNQIEQIYLSDKYEY